MRIEVNVTKKRFFVLLFAILLLGVVGVVYAFGTNNPSNFGHSVGEIDWEQEIPNSIKVKGLITVNGQQALYADGEAITVGDLAGGDGQRDLILRAGDGPRMIIDKVGNIGIGLSSSGSYAGKQSKLDVAGYAAANDIWLKDKGRWASYQQTCSLSCSEVGGNCGAGKTFTGQRWTGEEYRNICCSIVCS